MTNTGTGTVEPHADMVLGISSWGSFEFNGNMSLVEVARKAWTAADVQNSFNAEKALFGVN